MMVMFIASGPFWVLFSKLSQFEKVDKKVAKITKIWLSKVVED